MSLAAHFPPPFVTTMGNRFTISRGKIYLGDLRLSLAAISILGEKGHDCVVETKSAALLLRGTLRKDGKKWAHLKVVWTVETDGHRPTHAFFLKHRVVLVYRNAVELRRIADGSIKRHSQTGELELRSSMIETLSVHLLFYASKSKKYHVISASKESFIEQVIVPLRSFAYHRIQMREGFTLLYTNCVGGESLLVTDGKKAREFDLMDGVLLLKMKRCFNEIGFKNSLQSLMQSNP